MENEKMETQTKEKKQQDMEAAVQADIVGMYPDNPEHPVPLVPWSPRIH